MTTSIGNDITTKYAISGDLTSERTVVIISWNNTFVHKTLQHLLRNHARVIKVAFTDGCYVHENSDKKLSDMISIIGSTKNLLFVGCSRAAHASIWFAAQDWKNTSVSAIAICPQADYLDLSTIPETRCLPSPTGGNLLDLHSTPRVRIYCSDHPMDKLHANKLKQKWPDVRYVPYVKFKGKNKADNPHLLGNFLTIQPRFAGEILRFMSLK